MADIRIKDLAVTAGSSASDDYLAVDGSTNGTRKLSAYSPTFGGNLTVSGTGNNVFRGTIRWGNTSYPGYNGYITETNTASLLIPAITRNLIGTTGNTQYTIANSELGAYAAFELGADIRWFAGSGTFTTGQTITPTELMRLTQGGNLLIGTTSDVGAKIYSKVTDGTLSFGAAGTTKGIRFAHASTYSSIDGVDSSLSGSYQPLQINGSTVQIATNGGTVAASFDTSQNATFAGQVMSAYTGDWVFKALPTSGADRNLALFGVSGATNGLTVKWNHSTSTLRINLSNLPTSSSGLAAGDLYNSGGTIKIA